MYQGQSGLEYTYSISEKNRGGDAFARHTAKHNKMENHIQSYTLSHTTPAI